MEICYYYETVYILRRSYEDFNDIKERIEFFK